MTEEKTFQEESQDQPNEDSAAAEQPQEESQDQPTTEVEGATEEAAEEEIVEIDGQTYSPEELRELVSKGKDYTRKTQELAEQRRQIEAMRATAQQPAATIEEDDEIRQAKATLKKYNVAFAEDVDEKIRRAQIEARMNAEFETFRIKNNLSPKLAAHVRLEAHAEGKTYEQALASLKAEFGGNKIVPRKIVGMKKSASSPILSRGSGSITRADIANMPPEKYQQLVDSGELDRLIQSGELK